MKYISAGESLTLDSSLCIGEGRCLEVCPHNVFSIVRRKATIADRTSCMQCGACQRNCPVGAISVSTGVGCAALIVSRMRKGKTCGGECECR